MGDQRGIEMKLPAALGIALASLTMAAYADPAARVFVRVGGPELNLDADNDGWVTRAEAAAAAERLFARLDSNSDGRLNDEDRSSDEEFDIEIARPGHPGHPGHPGQPGLEGENCSTTVEPAEEARAGEDGRRVERRVTVICEGGANAPAADEGRRIERHVTVIRHGPGGEDGVVPVPPVPPVAPVPPVPAHPPMFMMMFGGADESDLNGDGALSRDEFQAQHLRFFDATDANRDGRIRAVTPPEPPAPPAPPAPPEPPRRR
jgi:hypothetical protein